MSLAVHRRYGCGGIHRAHSPCKTSKGKCPLDLQLGGRFLVFLLKKIYFTCGLRLAFEFRRKVDHCFGWHMGRCLFGDGSKVL